MASYKITALGDGNVGKTCLLMSYTTNTFPQDYAPTVFDSYETDIEIKGMKAHLSLTDTAGQEDFDKLRPLSYHGTDCFMICFSVASHSSLTNVKQRWLPELKQHKQSHVPFILVATKIDLRNEKRLNPISEATGRTLAKEIGASAYMECSAKTLAGLHEVFGVAVDAARAPRNESKCRCSCCSIM